MLQWFDRSDIAGLNAPRPTLLHFGELDVPGPGNHSASYNETVTPSVEELRAIYRALGAPEPSRWRSPPGHSTRWTYRCCWGSWHERLAFTGRRDPGELRTISTGRNNLVDAVLPPLGFVVLNAALGLEPALIGSLAISVGLGVWRLARRQGLAYVPAAWWARAWPCSQPMPRAAPKTISWRRSRRAR